MNINFLFAALLLSLPIRAQQPQLSFFTELPAPQLKTLFADSSVIANLRSLKAAVRMGMLDFTPERAEVVRRLNQQGVPVVAWLLLPEEQGYWFNMDNGPAAGQRYAQLRQWTRANNLRWAGVGIDLEASMDDIKLMTNDFPAALRRAYGRLFTSSQLKKATADYGRVLAQIRADGYSVESYILPFMLDERRAGTTAFQRATGMLDLPVATEIPMVYSSFFGPDGAAFIPVYGRGLRAVAIGSTGGGVKIKGMKATPPTLTWPDLERDLLLAGKVTRQVHIFCLESCVEKGYLPKLAGIDYSRPAPDLSANVAQLEQTRRRVQTVLVVLDHPVLLTAGVILLVGGVLALLVWGGRWLVRRVSHARNEVA